MNFELTRQLKIAIAIFGGLLLLGLGFFIATHGILIVNKDVKESEYTIHKLSDQQFERRSTTSSWSIVQSGTYTLEYKDSNAQQTKYVEVPNFLRSVTANFKQTVQRHVERVAAKTLSYIARSAQGEIIGVNTDQDSQYVTTHPGNDPTGENAGTRPVPFSGTQTFVHNNHLASLVPTQAVEYDVALTMHDFSSGQTSQSTKIYPEATPPRLIKPSSATSNSYGAYVTEGENITLDIYDGTRVTHTFKAIKDVATGVDTKAIGVSKQYVVMGFGENYASPTADHHLDGEELPPPSKDYIVKIYDTNQQEVRSFNLGKINTVANLYVTDDGKYVAVEDGTTIKVYDSFTGTQVFAYTATNVSSIQWRGNERLLFSSDEGLFELNPKEQSAITLFANDSLRISSFQVTGNQVLFTAFSNRSNTADSFPDGYIAYLDQDAKDANQLITKLPFTNEQFKLASLKGTIYAAKNEPFVTRVDASGDFMGPEFRPIQVDEAFKKSVTEYLQNNLQNYQQYTLVFGENL